MSSLIDGFEYDIFISYRHNDNLDGWVTEFVQNLEKELRGTIKDSITLYFDSNPHDGLLETHNVDKSLEGKLKCLIFIPILSQTYCDPKSFAWQHEFVAFNKLAKEDQFGRDIKLSNGNVASRILPIKIHDLDAEDKSSIENEIGGVIRAIDFIYKSGGVNRPLNSKDDEVRTSGKILYRDQVNKVANAIKEIITSLKNPVARTTRSRLPDGQATNNNQPTIKPTRNRKPFIASIILVLLILAGYFIYQQWATNIEQLTSQDKSIAVLPFTDMSPGKDQEYLGDGIAEDIITALSRIKELKVIGRTSSFQFKGEKIDLRDLGEKLNVATVLEGSIMKSGNRIRITAQLINVSDGTHIWSERYDREMDDIFAIQDQISKAISDKMKISLLGNTQHNRERPTSNTEAFENYLRGQHILSPGKGAEAIPFFKRAIQLDSNYADAYAGLTMSYFFYSGMNNAARAEKMIPLVQRVRELNPESSSSYALYYVIYSALNWDWKLADEEYKKYLTFNPVPQTGHALRRANLYGDIKGGIEEFKLRLDSDPINKQDLRLIGHLYALDHQYGKAKEMINKAIEIDPYYAYSYSTLAWVCVAAGEFSLALETLKKIEAISSIDTHVIRMWALTKANRMREAQELYGSIDFKTIDFESRAKIEFWLGNLDEGFRWLDKALEERDNDVLSIRYNPEYDVVRDHPRFKNFIKKVPFPPNNL